jgi:hypothetical protein
MSTGISIGLILGLFTALVESLIFGSTIIPAYGLIIGSIGGFLLVMIAFLLISSGEVNEKLSKDDFWYLLVPLLIIGAIVGHSVASLGEILIRLVHPFIGWAISGIASGVIVGWYAGLITGMQQKELQAMTFPAQGLRQFLKTGSVFFMSAIMVNIFSEIKSTETTLGLPLVLINSAIFGLSFGGDDFIQHYFARLSLSTNGNMPINYLKFLDYCVDRVFLRRVGGGYIFIHRLLMEHFAAMYAEKEK